jgi:hypothetical protein
MATCTICRRDDLRYYKSYNKTAKVRLLNPDGSDHLCYPEPGPDIIECHCGVVVYRYTGGKKLNMDGGPHECARPVDMPAPPPAHKSTTQPPAPRNGWRVPSTTVERG